MIDPRAATPIAAGSGPTRPAPAPAGSPHALPERGPLAAYEDLGSRTGTAYQRQEVTASRPPLPAARCGHLSRGASC